MASNYNLDWLISVDDHILEPPHLWVSRVAVLGRDRAPHMEIDDNGMDFWVYDGKKFPSSGLSAVVGRPRGSGFSENANEVEPIAAQRSISFTASWGSHSGINVSGM